MPVRTQNKILNSALLVLLIPVNSLGDVISDWSRVQSVVAGRGVRVSLYDDASPKGMRRINGRFISASPNQLMISIRDGSTRYFSIETVRRVEVRLPFKKRYGAWGITGLAMALTLGIVWFFPDFSPFGGDIQPRTRSVLQGTAVAVIPAGVVSFLALRYASIYNVPEKHRVRSVTKQTRNPVP